MARRLCTLAAATAALSLAALASADQKWIEVRTPHFTVVANTGEGAARDAGWQFEQVRHVFQTLWPWARAESGRPFVVFVLKGEGDLKALAPKYWENGGDGGGGASGGGRGQGLLRHADRAVAERRHGHQPLLLRVLGLRQPHARRGLSRLAAALVPARPVGLLRQHSRAGQGRPGGPADEDTHEEARRRPARPP